MADFSRLLTSYAHPLVQFLALALMIYVLYLGKNRFLSLHCGKRCPFAWKNHVRFGTWSMAAMLLGGIGGLVAAGIIWGVNFTNAVHAWQGMAIMALIASGYASGLALDKKIRHTALFTAFHGLNNLILIALALWAMYTGWEIIGFLG